MSGWLIKLLLLTLIYVLMLGSFAPLNLLLGGIISGLLLLVFHRLLDGSAAPVHGRFFRRMLAFPAFVGAVSGDILRSTWDVVLRVIRLRPLERPDFVAIAMGERTPVGVAVSALVMTLSPGAVLVTVDWERRQMLFHLIDATDPQGFEAAAQAFYRRYQQHVFP